MKKILSIALIAALALTSVFAATYNGKAALELGYDLDKEDYGFVNSLGHKLSWTLELETGTAGSEGEADLRAAIAAEFSVGKEIADDDDMEDGNFELKDFGLDAEAKITKADILYKDIVRVGILDAGKSADYAKAFYEYEYKDKDGKDKKNKLNIVQSINDGIDDEVSMQDVLYLVNWYPMLGIKYPAGLNFTVAGFNGGFGLVGNTKYETVDYLAWAETKSFDLYEGLTAQAAAAVTGNKDNNLFTLSAKTAYKNEEAKVSASLATDFGYMNFANEGEALLDLALNASYDFVTLDAYVGTADSFENTELGAKITATYKFENGSVGGSFAGQNMADMKTLYSREFTATVKGDYTYQPVKAEAEVSYAIIAKKLTVKPAVSYLNDLFTAKAGLELVTVFGEKDTKVTKIAPTVSVSSDKIINNATLELGWTGADFAEGVDKKGKIATSATISF